MCKIIYMVLISIYSILLIKKLILMQSVSLLRRVILSLVMVTIITAARSDGEDYPAVDYSQSEA